MVEMEQVRAGRGEVRVVGNREGSTSSLPEAFLVQLSQVFHSWDSTLGWSFLCLVEVEPIIIQGVKPEVCYMIGPRASGNWDWLSDQTHWLILTQYYP